MGSPTSENCDSLFYIATAWYCNSSLGLLDGGAADVPLFQFTLNPEGETDFLEDLGVRMPEVMSMFSSFAPYKVVNQTVYISATAPVAWSQVAHMMYAYCHYQRQIYSNIPHYKFMLHCTPISFVLGAPPPVLDGHLRLCVHTAAGPYNYAVDVLSGPEVVRNSFAQKGFRSQTAGSTVLSSWFHACTKRAQKSLALTIVREMAKNCPMDVMCHQDASELTVLLRSMEKTGRVRLTDYPATLN